MSRILKVIATTFSCLLLVYCLIIVSVTLGVQDIRQSNRHHEVELIESTSQIEEGPNWSVILFFNQDVVVYQQHYYLVIEKEGSTLQVIGLSQFFSFLLPIRFIPFLIIGCLLFFIMIQRRQRNSLSLVTKQVDTLLSSFGETLEESKSSRHTSYISHALSIISRHLQQKQSVELESIYLDKLTGLIDRHAYLDYLKVQLKTAQQQKNKCALLFIDLDGFKQVNDSFGHSFGDEILIQVGQRLKEVLRTYQLNEQDDPELLERNLARLGGDEFSIFINSLSQVDFALKVATNILSELERDFVLGNKLVKIGASIGIAIYPDSAATPNTLLQMADVAMYRAKNDGRGIYRVFSPEMGVQLRRYHYLLEELRTALVKHTLSLSFQPVVNSNNFAIDHFESLARWQHPDEGAISPSEFIPIAEDSNLIMELGKWVLWESCRQMVSWRDAGLSKVKVSVNISKTQLKHVDMYDWVMKTLGQVGLAPTALILEITESSFIDAPSSAIEGLAKLRKEGVSIAVDDFGAGLSSLSGLAKLPIDIIKIDKLFLASKEPQSDKLLSSIFELGQQLDLNLVAEGVETYAQLEQLRHKGIKYVQGYLFGQPETADLLLPKFTVNKTNYIIENGTSTWDLPPQS